MHLPFIVLVMQDITEHDASSTTLVQSLHAAMQPHAPAMDKHHSPAHADRATMAAHVRTTTLASHPRVPMEHSAHHLTTSHTVASALRASMTPSATVSTHALPTLVSIMAHVKITPNLPTLVAVLAVTMVSTAKISTPVNCPIFA